MAAAEACEVARQERSKRVTSMSQATLIIFAVYVATRSDGSYAKDLKETNKKGYHAVAAYVVRDTIQEPWMLFVSDPNIRVDMGSLVFLRSEIVQAIPELAGLQLGRFVRGSGINVNLINSFEAIPKVPSYVAERMRKGGCYYGVCYDLFALPPNELSSGGALIMELEKFYKSDVYSRDPHKIVSVFEQEFAMEQPPKHPVTRIANAISSFVVGGPRLEPKKRKYEDLDIVTSMEWQKRPYHTVCESESRPLTRRMTRSRIISSMGNVADWMESKAGISPPEKSRFA
jgi:hypothetical protein